MAIPGILKTIVTAPYYRRNWFEAVRELNTALQFKRHRIYEPSEFLDQLGIDPKLALDGFDRWRGRLENAIAQVAEKGDEDGSQGGCSIEDGTILYGLARALKPRVVIETGVAAGISTSFIGAALAENGSGQLYSIELPPAESFHRQLEDGVTYEWASTGVGWAVPADVRAALAGRHQLILEDVRTALPRLLAQVPAVDLYFHDDLHTPSHMRWQYELVWPAISPGGVLASDDANTGWIDFCKTFGLTAGKFANLQRLTAMRKPVSNTHS